MGYGFVGFHTTDGAKRGLKSIDGMVLDGHKLSAKWAGRGAEDADGAVDKETVKARTTKMIVKNVPFEATKKDIRELFGYVPSPLFYCCKLIPQFTVRMVTSNPCACRRSSTLVLVDSHS